MHHRCKSSSIPSHFHYDHHSVSPIKLDINSEFSFQNSPTTHWQNRPHDFQSFRNKIMQNILINWNIANYWNFICLYWWHFYNLHIWMKFISIFLSLQYLPSWLFLFCSNISNCIHHVRSYCKCTSFYCSLLRFWYLTSFFFLWCTNFKRMLPLWF